MLDDQMTTGECIRCGQAMPGRMHWHLPWSGNPFDLGLRFYCDICWRKVCIGAIAVIIFGIVTIGGLGGLLLLLTSLS